MQMWDSGTHMTKQEWLRSCKRVQTRLDNLNVEAVVPKPKTLIQNTNAPTSQQAPGAPAGGGVLDTLRQREQPAEPQAPRSQ